MNGPDREDTLMTLQSRLAEVVTVVFMAIHVGIYGRILLGRLPGSADWVLLYSGATAFYIALLYYTSVRLRRCSSVWGFTVAAALTINLVASSTHLMLALGIPARAGVGSTARVIAGPIAQLYLWSVFLYSFLLEASRRWQGREEDGSAGRVLGPGRFQERWWASLLTAAVVAVLPVAVLLSEAGTIPLDVGEIVISFVDIWDPLIYVFLFGAYLLMFRLARRSVLRHLTVLFAITAVLRFADLARSSLELVGRMGPVGSALWGVAALLPLVSYYLWLRIAADF